MNDKYIRLKLKKNRANAVHFFHLPPEHVIAEGISFSLIKDNEDDLLEFDQSDHFTYKVERLSLHFRVLNLTMATEDLPLHSYLNFDLEMDHVCSFFHWLSRYCY